MPDKAQARIDPRVAADFRVDLEYPWQSGAWSLARSLDLSSSGIYVGSESDLPLKAQVGCRIHLPSPPPEDGTLIEAQAIVVRINPPVDGTEEWRYGLYFVELSEIDAEAIRKFIFAKI